MSVTSRCYSATVAIQLRVNGDTLAVRQMGLDSIILDAPASIPPTNAELILRIDDHETRGNIFLPDGLTAGFCEARIEKARPSA